VLRLLDPIQPALMLAYVGLLGLHDGFAALAPAETPASLGWPDRLLVNDACVGGVCVAHGPLVEKEGITDVPDWLVIGSGLRAETEPKALPTPKARSPWAIVNSMGPSSNAVEATAWPEVPGTLVGVLGVMARVVCMIGWVQPTCKHFPFF